MALRAARSRTPAGRTKANPIPSQDTQADYWPEQFRMADAKMFPALARMQPDLASFTDQAQFSAGLAALVQRFEQHLSVPSDGQR